MYNRNLGLKEEILLLAIEKVWNWRSHMWSLSYNLIFNCNIGGVALLNIISVLKIVIFYEERRSDINHLSVDYHKESMSCLWPIPPMWQTYEND